MKNLANGMVDLGNKKSECPDHGEYQSSGKSFFGNEVWTGCPACEHDAEIAKDQAEREKREAERVAANEKFYRDAGLVKRYWGVTLENFQPHENQAKAITIAQSFCDRFDEMADRGQTLVFCGNLGTGKTRLAHAIIQTLKFGRYVRAVDISRDIRASYVGNSESEREIIDGFVRPKILVIDEVGVQSETKNERMLLTDIIDRRYGEMLPTVICSNLNEKQLAEMFGDRAWSRLKQNCVICPLVGDDLRTR